MTSVSNRQFATLIKVKSGVNTVTDLNSGSSARPALSTSLNRYDIKGVNAGITPDDGFLRISVGGGTTTNVQSYIDMSGFSTIPDVDKCLVFGNNGIENARINSSAFTSTLNTASTSSSTGCFTLAGGLAINKTTDATSSTNGGTMTAAGGIACAKGIFVGTTSNISGILTSPNTTASTSSTTGSLKLAGGLATSNSTDATSSTNGGSLSTGGGMAVAKLMYVKTKIGLNTTSTPTDLLTVNQPGTAVSSSMCIQAGLSGSNSTSNSCNLINKFTGGGGGSVTETISSIYDGTTYGWSITDSVTNKTLLRIANAGDSTSSSSGSIVLPQGGVSISETTEAVSSSNGGSITTSGGMAVAKNVIVGNGVILDGGSAALSINGENFRLRRNRTTINSSTGQTLTAANIIAGYIKRTGLSAGQTDTFPAASSITGSISGAAIKMQWYILYNNLSSNSISLLPGPGNTIYGLTSINANSFARIYFYISNVTPSSESVSIFIK